MQISKKTDGNLSEWLFRLIWFKTLGFFNAPVGLRGHNKNLHPSANPVSANVKWRGYVSSAPRLRTSMKKKFEYRGYAVQNEAGRYVAQSVDGDDFTISSVYLLRCLRSIDALWVALDHGRITMATTAVPLWIRDMVFSGSPSIDLDLANGAAPPCAPVEILSFPLQKLAVISRPPAPLPPPEAATA